MIPFSQSDREREVYLQEAQETNSDLFPILTDLPKLRHLRFFATHMQPPSEKLLDEFVDRMKEFGMISLKELRSFMIYNGHAVENKDRVVQYVRLPSGWDRRAESGRPRTDIREEV